MTTNSEVAHNLPQSMPSLDEDHQEYVAHIRRFHKVMRGFVWAVGLTPLLTCIFLTYPTLSFPHLGLNRFLGYVFMVGALIQMVRISRKLYPVDARSETPARKRARCTVFLLICMLMTWVGSALGNMPFQ